MIVKATLVQRGDVATYCGETFRVRNVIPDPVSGLLCMETSGLPQYIAPDRQVEVRRPMPPNPKPFVVLTRRYTRTGRCIKRRHTFATAAAQSRFMERTKSVVTFYTI